MAEQNNLKTVWTPANIVTLLRILLIPVFMLVVLYPWREQTVWRPIVATIIFIVISCTDFIDGYLARSRNEVTNLGKFLDPLADKILVSAALLALVELDVLPSWVALIIIAREFIVSGIRMMAAADGVVIAASWYGKVKTVTQIIAVCLFLLKSSPLVLAGAPFGSVGMYVVSWIAMGIAVFFTILSMLDYFIKARTLFGFSASVRTAEQAETAAIVDESLDEFMSGDHRKAFTEQAAKVLEAARKQGKTVGTAESCTGGLIAAILTSVPGSSDVVMGGIVSYDNSVKHGVLGVEQRTLQTHGAVSEETACEMALGAQKRLGCNVAVSVTGIAGPGGAVPGKPVGTVWIGLSDGHTTLAQLHTFDGDRTSVRMQTAQTALMLLETYLSDSL